MEQSPVSRTRPSKGDSQNLVKDGYGVQARIRGISEYRFLGERQCGSLSSFYSHT